MTGSSNVPQTDSCSYC